MSEAKALYKAGFDRFVKGDTEAAVRCYREAIASDAQLAIARKDLSMVLAKQGALEEAIEAAEKPVELEPDDPLSQPNLSQILMQNGQIPEAEDAHAKAMGPQMKGTS